MAEKFINGSGLQHVIGKIKTDFVAKESGKGLSTNDFTTAEKTKLGNIADEAQVNVIEVVKVNNSALAVSNKEVNVVVPTKVSDLTNDAKYITLEEVPEGVQASNTTPKMASENGTVGTENAFARGDHAHPHDDTKVNKSTTVNGKALTTDITLGAGDVGAVPTTRTINNKALSADITLGYADVGAAPEEHTHLYAGSATAGGPANSALECTGNSATATALKTAQKVTIGNKEQSFDGTEAISFTVAEIGAIATSAKGVANGVATLDAEGKVPSSQLPSYVDDVVEGYYHNGKFYQEASYTTEIVAMSSKIYVDLATNKTYRYGGSTYVEITSGDMVALTTVEIDEIYANA